MDQSLFMDTQLGEGESGLCSCFKLQHITHRSLTVNNEVIGVLSSDMENSYGQLEILVPPLSSPGLV